MKKKIGKKLFFFEVILSEFVVLNCLYQKENTCHRHSVCEETVLRFCILLSKTFHKKIAFQVIHKYGKGAVLQI